MSEDTLMTILIVLLLLLVPLLLSYWPYPDEKPARAKKEKKEVHIHKSKTLGKRGNPPTFKEIEDVFKEKESTKEALVEAIEDLIRYHGKIHAKLGDLPHPDFKRYLTLIIEVCNNPQTDKDVIVLLDQKLGVKNPKYRLDIDEATNKGIAGRGF